VPRRRRNATNVSINRVRDATNVSINRVRDATNVNTDVPTRGTDARGGGFSTRSGTPRGWIERVADRAVRRVHMYTSINHRSSFNAHPETCACILREAWVNVGRRREGERTPHRAEDFGRGKFNAFTTVLAIRRGHLNCLKYAIENGCAWHRTALHVEGWNAGHYECVKYALDNKVHVDSEVVEAVCRDCNSRILGLILPYWDAQNEDKSESLRLCGLFRFMDAVFENLENRCYTVRPDEVLKCVELLRSFDCPWSGNATKYAARKGDVKLLRYLVNEGCPWHPDTIEAALASGNRDVMAFAEAHGQNKNLEDLFAIVERYKQHMPEIEYINLARAAKELHEYVNYDA